MNASRRWMAPLVALGAWLILASTSTSVFGVEPTPTDTPSPVSGADLSVAIDAPGSISPAGSLTYRLSVRNDGTDPVDEITVVDTLPAGVTYVSAGGTDWTCTHDRVAHQVICARSLPLLGDAPLITVEAVAPNESGTIVNVIAVSASGDDADPIDNNVTAPTTVVAAADLSLLKLDGQDDPVAAAGPLTYTLRVSNLGPNIAPEVVVEDTLPSAVTFVGAAGRDWDCAYKSDVRQVTCVRASLAAASTAPDIIISATAPSEGGTIASSAVVNAASVDPNIANNSDSEDTIVLAAADLAITARLSRFGLPLAYSVTVANAGPSTATGVSLRARLPIGATLIASTPPSPACTGSDGTIICEVGDLPPGSSSEVTMQIYATPLAMTPRVTTVEVTSATRDLNTANNAASQTMMLPWYALYVPMRSDVTGNR